MRLEALASMWHPGLAPRALAKRGTRGATFSPPVTARLVRRHPLAGMGRTSRAVTVREQGLGQAFASLPRIPISMGLGPTAIP